MTVIYMKIPTRASGERYSHQETNTFLIIEM